MTFRLLIECWKKMPICLLDILVNLIQVSTRIEECHSALEVLKLLNEGKQVYEYCLKPSEQFISSVKGRLLTKNVGVAGHSFGGVTAVKATVK